VTTAASVPARAGRRTATAILAALFLLLGLLVRTESRAQAAAPYPLGQGYWLVASDGGIFTFGAAKFWGSTGSLKLGQPVVGMAPFPYLEGYWLVAGDGGVFAFGSADFWGSMGGVHLNKPIVGMAAHPSGLGYWMVATDGGVFSFGASKFKGSHGGSPLAAPIVGIAAAPDGSGYWIVGADGSVFNYGPPNFGDLSGKKLNQPIVGMAVTPTGLGYWLVASDGGVFAFGDAQFMGSEGARQLNKPIVGISPTATGNGYWLDASDGGVFSHGDAVFQGSTGGLRLNQPVLGMGAKPPLALRADPYAAAGSVWDNSTPDEQLSLTWIGGPPPTGARILGVEGLTAGQLQSISFKMTAGTCTASRGPQFVLVVDSNGDGAGDTTRRYACTGGIGTTSTFTPTTGPSAVDSSSVVTALDITSTNGATVMLDDITVAGIVMSDHRTFTASGPQPG